MVWGPEWAKKISWNDCGAMATHDRTDISEELLRIDAFIPYMGKLGKQEDLFKTLSYANACAYFASSPKIHIPVCASGKPNEETGQTK